ncbi:ATP-binding protein [Quadrisphaera sp. DSM 44207]|uniref:ATP-binding protein n=1 Tax=Quadrisphaera sp. DSM 44207 TaxID=1881057 RepID=UPI000882265B|nr:ATP-binding protein [Quadrisphaera sp. DSM 44207]SDQ68883.1 HAMP domain-containing protein [Quadrisphaera sp. DSM 44207]
MRRARTPSVAGGLGWAFGLLVALLVAVGGAGVVGLVAAGEGRERELAVERLRDANQDLLLAMTGAETGVRGYRLARDRSFLEPFTAGREAFRAGTLEALALAEPGQQRRLVEEQRAVGLHWFRVYGDPVSAMAPGEVEVSHELTLRNRDIFERLRATNGELEAVLGEERERVATLEERLRRGAVAGTVLALAVALGVAALTAARARRSLVRPLSDLVGVLASMAAGEERARADAASGPAEVRAVARSLNALAGESERLRQEQEGAARLARLAGEIGRSIRDRIDAQESVVEALSRVGEELGADRAWLRLLDGTASGAVERSWARAGLPPLGPPSEPGGSPAQRAVREHYARGDAVVLDDVAGHERLPAFVHDALVARAGARSAVLVPVGAGEEAMGVLGVVTCADRRCWSEREVALVRSVAADLGRALVLAGLYRRQQELVEQLRALDRTKSDFLSAVSHELRTPLTSIAGYVELIRDGEAGEVPEDVEAMLAVVDRNTRRLRTLIEDLLALSRIESGAFRVSRADVALGGVAAAAVETLRPAAAAAGLGVDVEGCEQHLLVHGDAGQLEQALRHLLSNAVKFTPPGGRVAVRARAEQGWAVVEVADTGIGVPEAEQAGMFSRFFRASNATRAAIQGTGLGLTIVRSIVEHHDGVLAVTSAEGAGTTVAVRLPLAPAPAPAPALVG